MIRIEDIEIQEFRGIRKLNLSLGQKNFGICGPNGTGKSGIVDAIEFALTGDITRLGGSGTAELSVKSHAPHVDARGNPEKCLVKIKAYVPALKKSITIERCVKTPASPQIFPTDIKVESIVAQLATHPEFALSRREIVKYILTPAGQRSKDVQALLRLDQIEKVRQSLQKIANDTKKESQSTSVEDERAKRDLLLHLGIKLLSKSDVLAAVNERRKVLQLEPLADFKPETSLKEGVSGAAEKKKPGVIKATSLAEIVSFHERVAAADAAESLKLRGEALDVLKNLQSNPTLLESFRRQVLIQQGLELLEEDACPLCDKAWNMAELQAHLQQKLANATEAAGWLQKLQDILQPVVDNWQDMERDTAKIVSICQSVDPKIDPKIISEFLEACQKDRSVIEQVCVDPSKIDAALIALTATNWKPTAPVIEVIKAVQQRIEALPDPSKEEEAREFLIVAQERYDRCRSTKREKEMAAQASELSSKALSIYGTTSNGVLEGIYDAVEKDFTDYYRIINEDDEGKFAGELTPSPAKLALDVDFYGRGKFPPGAYHSEGHQDGMGLCLYLALMKHTLGEDFTFAVLDDVLMSVDAGHRRQVCTLLKTKFSKTQFLLTTHDPVWLQFMRTENLLQSSVTFAGWTVDTGPQVWDDGDVWQQIAEKLGKNDVPGAASTLRRYLEYVATVLADNLRAPVEYHGNGHYDLGDLMPPVTKAWKTLIGLARDAAKSWGQDTKTIEAFAADAKDKIAKSSAEQWLINKSVHYNAWATLQKKEFEVVAAAFQELLKSMQCSKCAEFLQVSPHKGDREALRCSCGTVNFNLKPN